MEHKEFQIKTTDGLNLFAQVWLTKKPAKALVVIVHGLGEHSSRYGHVAKIFNEQGFNVFAFDLRGHGRSEGPLGRIPSYAQFNSDITSAVTFAKQEYGKDQPVFMYGHSLGASAVLYCGLLPDLDLNGIIATSPSMDISSTSKVKILLAKILNPILPGFTMSSGLDANTLSRDKTVVEAYKNDPLVHDQVSVRLGRYIMEAGEIATKQASHWYLPLLVMHGTEDRLCGIKGTDAFMELLKGDITYKRWEGLYHETHNEPEKEYVIQFMADWINAHI